MTVSAQENILLRGFVYDKDARNAPLGMAAVQIKNTQLGGLTDDDGYFEIPIPKLNLKDSLKVSYVGYTPVTLSIANYKPGDTLRVYLGASFETKEEVVVVAMNAKSVLIKAIDNMRKNFLFDSLISTGFYRQYHKENGRYVRLIEADVSVAFHCKSPYRYSFHELIRVNKLRRSLNYETNGDEHGDHLVDLLKENPYSYNRNNFLDKKKLDFYAPKFIAENDKEYVISVQYKDNNQRKLEQARMWVSKDEYAITQIEIEKYPNPDYVPGKYENETRWKLVNEKNVIHTERVNGKYVVSSIERIYNHHVLNRQTGSVDYVVEETFELHFYDYQTKNVGASLGRFGAFSDLYTTKYGYNPKFWDSYEPLEDNPTPAQVVADLNEKRKIEEQFGEAGK
ncbi:MAG: carboxypeptidase-like regulatory domain-containing protein [Chitinophagales bacterium]|nr:carboxypeptidase-like regulatory domain-containing protein [Chitinophagales bacterium]MDW8419951.1 carboxypeptidase-like regulatory domain-containing protein [Chitinophagales bacterium]